MSKEIEKAKADWIDSEMKRILEPDLYEKSRTGDVCAQQEVRTFLSLNGYHLKHDPVSNVVELCKHAQVVGRFSVKINSPGASELSNKINTPIIPGNI